MFTKYPCIQSVFPKALKRILPIAMVGLSNLAFGLDSTATVTPAPTQSTVAPSSGTSSGSPYVQGERVGYIALGLGGLNGMYGNMSVPPIGIGYDVGVEKNASLGALLAYARSSYNYGYLSNVYDWSYNYITLAGKAAYHITDLIKDMPVDPYAALTLGYNIVTVSGPNSSSASGSYVFWGVDVGARYWFKPNFAAQLEVGYGVGIISFGLAYRM